MDEVVVGDIWTTSWYNTVAFKDQRMHRGCRWGVIWGSVKRFQIRFENQLLILLSASRIAAIPHEILAESSLINIWVYDILQPICLYFE